MDLTTLIVQWSGKLPVGFVRPALIPEARPQCQQPRCKHPIGLKKNGKLAKSCSRCLERRARSCKRQDAIDAAVIDELAAKPDKAHMPSNLDCGISPWNARPKPEPSAAYWSPLPDPEPKSEQLWRHSLSDTGWRFSRR